MCSGSTSPGNRTVPSGNNGSRVMTSLPRAFARFARSARSLAGAHLEAYVRAQESHATQPSRARTRSLTRLSAVLTRLDLRTATPDRVTLRGLLPRAAVDVAAVTAAV